MSIVFADIIKPLTREEFFATYWERSIVHISRNDERSFDDILNAESLDGYFGKGDISPLSIRFVSESVDIPGEHWTKQQKLANTKIIEHVANGRFFEYLAAGETVIISAAERSIATLYTFCREMEQEFRCRVQANIYVTPPNAQTFLPHYDTHDIFILQIIGNKTWQIFDAPVNLQTKLVPFPEPTVAKQVVAIGQGDTLYLPRGTVHKVVTGDELSVHISVSLYGSYGFSLIESLAELAADHEFFRRAVPHTDAGKADYIEEFKEQFTGLIKKYDVRALLAQQHQKFAALQKVDFQNRFMDLLDLEKLSLRSVVKRRAGITLNISESESDVEVAFGDESVTFPKILADAFAVCLQDVPFLIGDLPGLITDNGKVGVVKELVIKGLLQIVNI